MINLYHLRYFVDAARSGSLSGAAKKNRISQSAVSQGILSLEKNMGVPLTTHQKKVLNLTEEGRIVLENSENIFQSMERLFEATQDIPSAYSGFLNIGCTNTVAIGILPPILSELGRRYPKMTVRVRIANSEVIQDWLFRKDVDVGIFVDDGISSKSFSKTVLRSGHYVLFRKNKKYFSSESLVVTRSHRKEVQTILKQFKTTSSPLKIPCEITSWEAIKNYVLKRESYGICPDYVIESELKNGSLIIEPLRKKTTYQLIAVHRKTSALPRNTQLFMEALRSP